MKIIPLPKKIIENSGALTLNKYVGVRLDERFATLRARIEEGFMGRKVSFDGNDIVFSFKEGLPIEGYRLKVAANVTIDASDVKGAFYGFMTLMQLLEDDVIPHCEIEDEPRFPYRGIMLDVARHFFGKEEIKSLLANMAYYKMNVFHWHLTEDQGWRVEIKKYPELAPKACVRKNDWKNPLGQMTGKPYGEGCYFTQEDVKEIVAFAAERMITVVPEIDMPGHITSALSVFPELSCEKKPLEVSTKFGVKSSIGCVGNEDFIRFMKDIIDEMCELFPSPFFHIGGDEVPKDKWKSCPKCQKLMREKDVKTENDLQGYFTNLITEYLAEKGKKTIGWDEITETKHLRSDAIVQWWHGKEGGKWAERGGKAILSHNTLCYMDYPYIMTNLNKIYRLGPEECKMKPEIVKNILGIEAPLWTEFVYDKKKLEFMLYPRVQAVAEAAWTPFERKNYKDFETRLTKYLEEMEKQGICYCPPRKYNPVGLCSLRHRLRVARKIMKDPDFEVNC